MITIEDIRNPARQSGFDHVKFDRRTNGRAGRPFRGAGGGRQRRRDGTSAAVAAWQGPQRLTSTEAAQDYCDYINGLPQAIRDHKARGGRPDWARIDGVLHRDLPGRRRAGASLRHPHRGSNAERNMIERMTPRMAALMQDGDIAEAKAGIGRQQIVTGVGQLLLRRFELGTGARSAYLVLPSAPDDDIQWWLKALGITLITEED